MNVVFCTAHSVFVFWLLQIMVGALESCGDIVSVSCCDNEIFILKGDRDIIRLSNSPEGLTSNCEFFFFYICNELHSTS